MIKVFVNGAQGKMGQEVVKALCHYSSLFLLVGQGSKGEDLETKIVDSEAQVVVDFTTAPQGMENTLKILNAGARPVVGTSGFTDKDVERLSHAALEKNLGCIIAPNFSLGAILMMKFSKVAARFLSDVEIIELHHNHKIDSPSGTAIKTAEMIASEKKMSKNEFAEFMTAHTRAESKDIDSKDSSSARGEVISDIHVHSVRLPGCIAHQKVIFGGLSETLTLHHDSIHRESFMPGVLYACKKVMEINRLIYGLDNVIEF
jgi:4-hydroxy-tetrahydrodipicolinate reductase